MHVDEIEITEEIVRSLLNEQFPHWAVLSLQAAFPDGTDNKIFRLGESLCVRLPRTAGAAARLEKEMYTLQLLEGKLPLAIPKIAAQGKSSSLFPFPWAITLWIEGSVASNTKKVGGAKALAKFLQALHHIPTTNAPSTIRGKSLHKAQKKVEEALPLIEEEFDTIKLRRMWEKALEAKQWDKELVWIHGDLHPGNLIIQDKKLTGVIDFGLAGIGDPAADLMIAWTYLEKADRSTFKDLVAFDAHTWQRGRGWALFLGIVAYPYYKDKDLTLASIAKHTLHELLQENI